MPYRTIFEYRSHSDSRNISRQRFSANDIDTCCPRFASVILHYRVSIRRVRLALQQQQEAATFLKHDTLSFA